MKTASFLLHKGSDFLANLLGWLRILVFFVTDLDPGHRYCTSDTDLLIGISMRLTDEWTSTRISLMFSLSFILVILLILFFLRSMLGATDPAQAAPGTIR